MMATKNVHSASSSNDPYGLATGIQIASAATCKLSLFRDDIQLSTATGFLTENTKSWFLVTALHNFSGRDFFTRKCLSPQLAIPNKFRATVMVRGEGEALLKFNWDGNIFIDGKPKFLYDWSEEGGDIAVIEHPKKQGNPKLITMNDAESQKWTVFPGLDVFVLGYPSGLEVNRTPIWKKVSIASEPSQKVNERSTILIDGLTFKGMSGGPVIINQSQGFTDDKVYEMGKELATRLIGVYAGRYNFGEDSSRTLGFYWPIKTLDAIICEKRQVGDIGC